MCELEGSLLDTCGELEEQSESDAASLTFSLARRIPVLALRDRRVRLRGGARPVTVIFERVELHYNKVTFNA